ncbi:hypothetical protein LRS06_03900 [Hymenobacter sp. J193]|uniref:hypothetical protein n=1 Tax=Hymenobacter sp. J193 TaxID=2898429 RepID=UPI00215159EF|nr:hypothetical protein [Hymenobacter sp. J193]MCR5886932.1 hypothetical protein [Hymenobacter sp. J193]
MTSPAHFEDLGIIPDRYGMPVAAFRYYPQDELLYIQWYGNLTAEAVILAAKAELAAHKEHRISLILNDKTEATGDWTEAMSWLEFEWLPLAMEAGLRAFAYIFSPDLRNLYISQEFVEHVSHLLPAQLFYDAAAARRWLLHQHRAAS